MLPSDALMVGGGLEVLHQGGPQSHGQTDVRTRSHSECPLHSAGIKAQHEHIGERTLG